MNGAGGRNPLLVVLILLVLFVIAPGGCLLLKTTDSAAPTVRIASSSKGIGRRPVTFTIEADEPKYGVKDVRASFVQGDTVVPLGERTEPASPWWRIWRHDRKKSALLEVVVGRERIPELKPGQAFIRAEATNDSWAGFGRGRTTVREISVPVILTPPRVEVLSGLHYINQGGSECILYRVSESAEASGVRVGGYFFKGFPRPGGAPGDRFAIFAWPYDVPAGTAPLVVASDAAGNEATASFTYKLFPRVFNREKIEITDGFLQRVVPAILAETPSVTSEGDLVKDFLQINGPLRREDAARLVELAASSRPERLWSGAFTQLGNSKVEASFADHRTYLYKGQAIDQQDHLGFDLAVTANHAVDAAGDGVVALAEWFGIYGNAVVIDHGFGLMTLYAHLSSIDVKPGEKVTQGQLIGKSGATGLAGGDHLHFGFLVQGVPVNPVEWWDAHWIHDRIDAKLAPGS